MGVHTSLSTSYVGHTPVHSPTRFLVIKTAIAEVTLVCVQTLGHVVLMSNWLLVCSHPFLRERITSTFRDDVGGATGSLYRVKEFVATTATMGVAPVT